MRLTVTITAVTLTTLACAASPAAAANPPVTGSAGCAEQGQNIASVASEFGRAVGEFISTDAQAAPRNVAVGVNAGKANVCSRP